MECLWDIRVVRGEHALSNLQRPCKVCLSFLITPLSIVDLACFFFSIHKWWFSFTPSLPKENLPRLWYPVAILGCFSGRDCLMMESDWFWNSSAFLCFPCAKNSSERLHRPILKEGWRSKVLRMRILLLAISTCDSGSTFLRIERALILSSSACVNLPCVVNSSAISCKPVWLIQHHYRNLTSCHIRMLWS